METYNKFIDIKKKTIYNYDITIIFDNIQDFIDNQLNKIDIITSITNIFFKSIKYSPSSEEIINIINKFKVRDLETYKNYLLKNEQNFKNKKFNLINDSCLVTVCFNEIDKEWISRNSKIFSDVYIISYKKYNINLENVHIIYSENNPANFLLDIIFFSNDIKVFYNKIFYLNYSQKIGLINGMNIDYDIGLVRSYIKGINVKNNYKYCKSIINIKNEIVEIDQESYFFCRNKFINFINSNICNTNKSKYIISALVINSDFFKNKTYANECSNIYSIIYPDNIFKIRKPFIFEKYIAEYNNSDSLLKKSSEELEGFIEDNFKYQKFYFNINKKMTVRNDNLFSSYDYQFYDNSIILDMKSSSHIENNILLIAYLYYICNVQKRKFFIKWNLDISYQDIFSNYFYLFNDSSDEISKYKTRLYDNSTDNLIISSNDNISVVCLDKFLVDNSSYRYIKENIIKFQWSDNIKNFFNYFNKNIKINLSESICIDVELEDIYLLDKYLNYSSSNTIAFYKIKSELIKYTQIPLNLELDIHKIIKLIILSKSIGYIYGKKDNISYFYDMILFKKNFLLDNLLNVNNCLTYDKIKKNIILKEIEYSIKQIYFKDNIKNGNLLILTSDKINNKLLEEIGDIKYINEVYIITDNNNDDKFYNYKFKYIITKLSKSIVLNNIIKRSTYDKIIVSDFFLTKKFFLYNELNGSNFFTNKSRNFCYFTLGQFLQINGFNENSNEYIYDFVKRLNSINYEKKNIKGSFDLSNKEFFSFNETKKFWGKENMQVDAYFKKKGKHSFLLT